MAKMPMEWFGQRCQALLSASDSALRQGYLTLALLMYDLVFFLPPPLLQIMSFSLLMYPVLRTIVLHLHSAVTGSYIPGSHSIALVNCPNEQTARDIARAIMERKLAACVNILPKASSMYIWNGEIEETTEILLLMKTRTSKINELSEYISSLHPFAIPEFISLLIDQGNPAYLKWMEESIPYD
ncbi:protein CutA homolog [Lacerta agilis]|uniref:protein CutA homolog n=1 Tax=Lacerta agilis TaxID=80427 RepID=UPI00141980E9|nr:protein CutA homolog [Lacerta agilis]